MSCAKYRKFLYAFADGQLGVKGNCEVLDHLKMCPACAAVVEDHQSVRRSLRRGAESIPLPHGFETRLRAALALNGRSGRARPRIGRALAIAACLAFAVLAAYQQGLFDPGDDLISRVPPGNHAASMVVARHLRCSALCEQHQDQSLPLDRVACAQAIRDHFSGQIAAIAPDLSGYGYEFESAGFCGINGDDQAAGHILYVGDDGAARLSFFSVPRWADIDEPGQRGSTDVAVVQRPSCYSLPQCGRSVGTMSVVAWHNGQSTYICCGAMDPMQMKSMVEEVRAAVMGYDVQSRLARLCAQPSVLAQLGF